MTVPDSVRAKGALQGVRRSRAVPAGKPAAKATAAKPGAETGRSVLTEEQDAKIAYGVTETSLAPRCPHCAYELDPPDAKICLHCGYHMTKRRREARITTLDHTGGDWFLHLMPGVLALIGFFAIIAFLATITGICPRTRCRHSGRGDPQGPDGGVRARSERGRMARLDVPSRHRGLAGRVPALHAVEVHELRDPSAHHQLHAAREIIEK